MWFGGLGKLISAVRPGQSEGNRALVAEPEPRSDIREFSASRVIGGLRRIW